MSIPANHRLWFGLGSNGHSAHHGRQCCIVAASVSVRLRARLRSSSDYARSPASSLAGQQHGMVSEEQGVSAARGSAKTCFWTGSPSRRTAHPSGQHCDTWPTGKLCYGNDRVRPVEPLSKVYEGKVAGADGLLTPSAWGASRANS